MYSSVEAVDLRHNKTDSRFNALRHIDISHVAGMYRVDGAIVFVSAEEERFAVNVPDSLISLCASVTERVDYNVTSAVGVAVRIRRNIRTGDHNKRRVGLFLSETVVKTLMS